MPRTRPFLMTMMFVAWRAWGTAMSVFPRWLRRVNRSMSSIWLAMSGYVVGSSSSGIGVSCASAMATHTRVFLPKLPQWAMLVAVVTFYGGG